MFCHTHSRTCLDFYSDRRKLGPVPIADLIRQCIMAWRQSQRTAGIGQSILGPPLVFFTIYVSNIKTIVQATGSAGEQESAAARRQATDIARPLITAVVGRPAGWHTSFLFKSARKGNCLVSRQRHFDCGRARFTVIIGSHGLQDVLARLGSSQCGLIRFLRTSGNERDAIIKVDFLYCAVRIFGIGSDSDIRKNCLSRRSETGIVGTLLGLGNADNGRGFVE